MFNDVGSFEHHALSQSSVQNAVTVICKAGMETVERKGIDLLSASHPSAKYTQLICKSIRSQEKMDSIKRISERCQSET